MSYYQTTQSPYPYSQYIGTSQKKLSQTIDGQTLKTRFTQLPSLQISMFSTTYSIKRVNQIKPKPKLVIPQKNSSIVSTSFLSSQVSSSVSQKSQSTNSRKQSIKYQQIKTSSFWNWKKYTPLCGFQLKTGQNGCLCGNPCPLQRQWTKNYKQTDCKLYQQLLNESVQEKQKIQIQKDILRTHPQCLTFAKNQRFQQMLKQVLLNYCAYDPQIGYVQGMNLIVGTILYHLKNSQLTFWAFVDLMDQKQLRMIYLPGFSYLHIHQQKIIDIMKQKVNDLFEKMNDLDILPQIFLNGWILSLMGSCIPLEYMHEALDKFRKFGWNYIYQLIITYLLFLKQQLFRAEDQSQFLQSLNTKNSRQYGIVWQQLIKSAQNFPLYEQKARNSQKASLSKSFFK